MENTKDNFYGLKFDGIQLLRAISAFLVSLYHIDFIYNIGINTAIGVDIFFIISGFIIMYTTQKSIENYGKKRIIKIVPLYWILTILTFFAAFVVQGIVPFKPTLLELLKSLFFIPYSRNGIRSDNVIRPIVGPAHTLLNEMFFYFIFWVSAKINHKKRGEICSVLLIILVILGKYFKFSNLEPLLVWSNMNMLEFVLGIVLFFILKNIHLKNELKLEKKWCIMAIIFSTVLMLCMMYYSNMKFFLRALLSSIIVCINIVVFFNIKVPQVLLKFGDISYSYYLIHYYIILIFKKTISPMDRFSITNIVVAMLAIICSIIIAYFSWKMIEVKFANYLKGKIIHIKEKN